MIASGMEVAENAVEGVLMFRTRISGVATEGGNSIGEVRTSPEHGVHE